MKKYKHKQTGNIATLVGSSGYKLDRFTIGLIPKELVENTNDWEEVKPEPKVLFKTYDGVNIYEGDYFIHTSGWGPVKTVKATLQHDGYYFPMDKIFSTKELAEEYVSLNHTCFSINDVIEALNLKYNYEYWNISTVTKRLKNLRESKIQK